MSNTTFRKGLTAAAAFTLVLAAPLAVAAQSQQNNQPQRGQDSQQQSRGQSQPDRGQSSERDQPQAPRGQNQNRGQSQQSGRYRITSTVNVRSGPGTNNRRVGQLRAGQVVSVDQVRNGWLHVQGQGWISASFARRA